MIKIVKSAEYDYFGRKKLIDKLCDEYYFLRRGVIGRSCAGRDITSLKIGSAEEYSLITAAFHGSESITAVCARSSSILSSAGKIFSNSHLSSGISSPYDLKTDIAGCPCALQNAGITRLCPQSIISL